MLKSDKYNAAMKLIFYIIGNSAKNWKQVLKVISPLAEYLFSTNQINLTLRCKFVKGLILLEFMIKNGADRVVEGCRDRLLTLREFKSFTFTEGGEEKGSSIREKSKQLIELLGNSELIRSEREKARALRHKFIGMGNSAPKIGGSGSSSDPYFGRESTSSMSSNNSCNVGSSDKFSIKESHKSKKNDKQRATSSSGANLSSSKKYAESDSDINSDEEDRKLTKTTSKKGGKLKVTIKSSGSSTTKTTKSPSSPAIPAPAVIDLLGDEIVFQTIPTFENAAGKKNTAYSLQKKRLYHTNTTFSLL